MKAEEALLSEEERCALFRVPDWTTLQGWRYLLLLLYGLGIHPNELVTAMLRDLDAGTFELQFAMIDSFAGRSIEVRGRALLLMVGKTEHKNIGIPKQ